MPSLNFGSSSPPTEAVRFESEPPGAEVKTSLGQSCRTPCELTVQSGTEMTVSFALNGYQPQTVQVRPDVAPTSYNDTGTGGKLQPNPVYAELRNIFDLSLVAAVVQEHDLPGQVGWHMTHFGPQPQETRW